MIISVEDRFDELYNNLKGLGYDVYRFSENVPSEVIVYSGGSTHIGALDNSLFTACENGAFLINGDNLSYYEVDGMIKNKAYSSLF